MFCSLLVFTLLSWYIFPCVSFTSGSQLQYMFIVFELPNGHISGHLQYTWCSASTNAHVYPTVYYVFPLNFYISRSHSQYMLLVCGLPVVLAISHVLLSSQWQYAWYSWIVVAYVCKTVILSSLFIPESVHIKRGWCVCFLYIDLAIGGLRILTACCAHGAIHLLLLAFTFCLGIFMFSRFFSSWKPFSGYNVIFCL